MIQGTEIVSPGTGAIILSKDGGEKGEIEFWFGLQPNGDYAIAVDSEEGHSEVLDVMRSELEQLKEQIDRVLEQ